jgi:DNA-binding transcriptional regulator GbsR (MarR family)
VTDLSVLRELFNARFDSLEAKIASMSAVFEKEIGRQDEAIERLADRATHTNETKRLTERVAKLENQIEVGRSQLNDLQFKVKVTWAVGGAIITAILAVLLAVIEKWIGV